MTASRDDNGGAGAAGPWSEETIAAWSQQVREQWPELPPLDAAFIRHLADVVPDPSAADDLRIPDLYLAYRCCRGERKAIAHFERIAAGPIAMAVRRVRSPIHGPDDLRQIVRDRLVVGKNPALESYKGQGKLAAWVGVVAMRTALNAARGKPRDVRPLDQVSELRELGETCDPELEYLRARYRADFRSAFGAAVDALDSRERALLHQHLVEKLTVREIARLYGVNSGTIARWVVSARTKLAERTMAGLRAQLEVEPSELESILQLIRTGVELSLSRVFGDAA